MTGEQEDRNWTFIESCPITEEHKITLPEDIRDRIIGTSTLYDDAVFLYLSEENFVVVAQDELSKDKYEALRVPAAVHSSGENRDSKSITVPKPIMEMKSLEPGDHGAYIRTEAEWRTDPPSVHLIFDSDLSRLFAEVDEPYFDDINDIPQFG